MTTANNASGQVSTLSGTVTALGQRVTTAEGNIGQNTSDITALTTRVGTAEGNITTLQNDVTIAQGNASSAMATAGQVKQQAFVFRYSSTALTPSSTNSNALLDNTDNLKVGDKVIDSSGVLFSITAIDTQNSTFTIGTALIDLAQDSDVVHKSGDETVIGSKRFGVVQSFTGYPTIRLYNTNDDINVLPSYAQQQDIRYTDKNNNVIAYFIFQHRIDANEPFRTCWRQVKFDGTEGYYSINFNNLGIFYPENNNAINLGRNGNRWKSVYSTEYYYGSNNVEFSNKFVTTDTAQTISGNKTFSSSVNVYNSDSATDIAHLFLKNQKAEKGGSLSENQVIFFTDKLNRSIASLRAQVGFYGQSFLLLRADNLDSSNNPVYCGMNFSANKDGTKIVNPNSNGDTDFGTANAKWKSFNGLEPSSLSLPSGNLNDIIDISSYFANTGTGDTNSYTAPANGWIYFYVTACRTLTAYIQNGSDTLYSDYKERSSDGQIRMMLPIQKNNRFSTQWTTSTAVSITKAVFIPCQGNV